MKQANPNTPSGSHMTPTPETSILETVRTLLTPYNRNTIAITRETAIMADLEVDSVAVFDLIMEVEDGYDITFPMETVSEMRTVGDLVDTIRVFTNA